MRTKHDRGVTLVEILIVMAILAIIAGLVFAVLPQVKQGALKSKCMANLRQVGLAINLYMTDYDDRLPSSLRALPKETPIRCPKAPLTYLYYGHYATYDKATKTTIYPSGFDPAFNAIVKCNMHNDWPGPFSLETSRLPGGVEFQYQVPRSENGVLPKYRVLGGFLDGHVKMVPDEDDWETAAQKAANGEQP